VDLPGPEWKIPFKASGSQRLVNPRALSPSPPLASKRIASSWAPPRSASRAASMVSQAVVVRFRHPMLAKYEPRYASLPSCSMTIFVVASLKVNC